MQNIVQTMGSTSARALFSFPGWLKAMSRKFGVPRRGPRREQRLPRRRVVPWLEALEGRLAPAVLTVNTVADDTTADNFLSLREAISVVNSGSTSGLNSAEQTQISGTLGSNDTIQFDPHPEGGTVPLPGGALSLGRSVASAGPGAASLTISGNNADRVFLVGQGTAVTLSGLTVTGGSAVSGSNNYGGGLLNN